MATRKQFKGVASGILGSFNSRNNDISGYWAIGVLNLRAQAVGENSVVFDLVRSTVTPEIPVGPAVAQYYGSVLRRLMEGSDLPETWLKSASIVVRFNQPLQKWESADRHTVDAPYVCIVEIVDDRDKIYAVSARGYCWPHDPKREMRRVGAEGITVQDIMYFLPGALGRHLRQWFKSIRPN